MKILHIGSAGAIMISFVDFANKNFLPQEHIFLLNPQKNHTMPEVNNIYNPAKLSKAIIYIFGLLRMYSVKKIILHGLFDSRLIFLLMLQPWLLKKCYWVIWGGDLYDHQMSDKNFRWKTKEILKKHVIRRFGHLITHIRGDYELAQKWYGARGQWHDCFMYPSNLYRDYGITAQEHDGINILLGNSASRTNCHVDAMEKLLPFQQLNIRIYCPLSYGDIAYGDEISAIGAKIFGDKFIPLRDFMPLEKYIDFLSTIDIALFNNNRQQGMGNITTLLGLGKKIYLKESITSFSTLRDMGLKVFDISHLNLAKISPDDVKTNTSLVRKFFSSDELIFKLRAIGF